ncbi:hypothetical protein [Actinotalea sp. JY-7885]|uniref:hypothetical protein n=1 Tax=Actinotalea sp. JY-7885 TaxID=2758576 RepID=UPI00165D6E91|nr:hypothetical protein [Actinotalea sp. JY-7885]
MDSGRPLTRRELRAIERSRAAADEGATEPPALPSVPSPAPTPPDDARSDDAPSTPGPPTPVPPTPVPPTPVQWSPVAPDDDVTVELPLWLLEAEHEREAQRRETGRDGADVTAPAAAPVTATDDPPAATPDAGTVPPGEPEPDAWDLAVGWSLRHEAPRRLPPEPEIDDVPSSESSAAPASCWSTSRGARSRASTSARRSGSSGRSRTRSP